MPTTTYATRDDARNSVHDGRLRGASDRLLSAVEEQCWMSQQTVGQSLAVLHARGMNVEGFDAASNCAPCPLPSALDLRAEAIACDRPWRVAHAPLHFNPSISVETLIVGARAGQVVGGDATWGAWEERAQHLVTDDGVVICLDGSCE
jgi:hypothetical protein